MYNDDPYSLGGDEDIVNPHIHPISVEEKQEIPTDIQQTKSREEKKKLWTNTAILSKDVVAPSPSKSTEYIPPPHEEQSEADALKELDALLADVKPPSSSSSSSIIHPASLPSSTKESEEEEEPRPTVESDPLLPTSDQQRQQQNTIDAIASYEQFAREVEVSKANVDQLVLPLKAAHDDFDTIKARCEAIRSDIQTRVDRSESGMKKLKRQLVEVEQLNLDEILHETRTFRDLNVEMKKVVQEETEKANRATKEMDMLKENICKLQEQHINQDKQAAAVKYADFMEYLNRSNMEAEAEHKIWLVDSKKPIDEVVAKEIPVLVQTIQALSSQVKEVQLTQKVSELEAKKATLMNKLKKKQKEQMAIRQK
jgi:hypothetical protein